MVYKVTVTFTGSATLQIEADSVEAARIAAGELALADLARAGGADLLAYKCAAREIKPASLDDAEDDGQAETRPAKPRPSGWYRPA